MYCCPFHITASQHIILKEKYLKNLQKSVSDPHLSFLLSTIQDYDFDYIDSEMMFVQRVCKELVLKNIDFAYKLLREYIKYIALIVLRKQGKINEKFKDKKIIFIPSPKIFTIWRFHILYSEKYKLFCKLISGKVIDFFPSRHFNAETLNNEEKFSLFCKNYNDFLNVYEYYYGSITEKDIWTNRIETIIDYSFRFCLFKEKYKSICNNKNNIIKNIKKINKERKLNTDDHLRKDIILNLNQLKNELFGKQDFQTEEKELDLDFFKGNTDLYLEIEQKKLLKEKYEFCSHFEFPNDFEELLQNETLLNKSEIKELILEYRRFLFLRIYKPKMIFTPSEEVDIVWHLHLNNTKFYRETMIKLFGYEYEHNPTKGGKSEHVKHKNLYEKTLKIYSKIYGNYNSKYWPIENIRFKENPYWFFLREEYIENERIESKKNKNNGNNILTLKHVLLMIVFMMFCVGLGAYIGYLFDDKPDKVIKLNFKRDFKGGD